MKLHEGTVGNIIDVQQWPSAKQVYAAENITPVVYSKRGLTFVRKIKEHLICQDWPAGVCTHICLVSEKFEKKT